ncbi:BCCT family transporter [Treponema pallidum]|uniref:Carnitine transporter, putative n=2 Tax=Treponema pallidum subsp. pallidum TaxID=161 RepID=O83144_TREPA|nr:BCCT family transporter [Treponema pallidum]AAC26554.1 carnitine transporter, putative [Treponema pallidum subsp. pallidum str. Nichols]ACD70533.1 possible carnitine transporter [Treponema pallidum subsp. pallidum SS14]
MQKEKCDFSVSLIPLGIVISCALLFISFPDISHRVIGTLLNILVNKLGFFYILTGLFFLGTTLTIAFSRYGAVYLGTTRTARYSNFTWGSMIFTSTMAADILYWSLIEWAHYFTQAPFIAEHSPPTERQEWAAAYPLFHWGIIPWSFYVLLAVAFGYMLHVKKRHTHKISEACRPLLGAYVDGIIGEAIDICSVVGLLLGVATTFSLATPLLSLMVSLLFGISNTQLLALALLCVIALVYTTAVLLGTQGISKLSRAAVYCFSTVLVFFLCAGPTVYLIETGITAIGKMLQNFFLMATWMDPSRISLQETDGTLGFPQRWTIFYWAYWITWSVATPFFIGAISEGRTIRNTIVGGLCWGIAGTYGSFIVLGNYGLYLQTHHLLPAAYFVRAGNTPAEVIIAIIQTLPCAYIVMALLAATMIAFYASTFDALTLIIASYSQKSVAPGEEPRQIMKSFWAVACILLPASLIFSQSTLMHLKSLAIIAAFPLALIMLCVVASFFKELRAEVTS